MGDDKLLRTDFVRLRNMLAIFKRRYAKTNYEADSIQEVIITNQVDPDTVCQFTGLKDREGNEVWEGDILEREIPKGTSDVVIRRAAVEFDEGHFVLGYNMTYPLGYTLGEGLFRVVGNVFDEKEGEK